MDGMRSQFSELSDRTKIFNRIGCQTSNINTEKFTLPQLTQQPIEFVDATPDREYPLRILRAYRERCNCFFEVSGLSDKTKQIYELMNKHQKERAKILDCAIGQLLDDIGMDA